MLTFETWSENHFNKLNAMNKTNGENFLEKTKESILADLEIVFGSKEQAEQELSNLLKQEYDLYTQRVELGIESIGC